MTTPHYATAARLSADSSQQSGSASSSPRSVSSDNAPGSQNLPRKYVVTVGCFDVFHHGHEALLRHMQEYGTRLLVGIHDDQSIFVNKKMKVAQNLEQRCRAVQEFAPEMIEMFEITEADPTNALKRLYAHHNTLATAQGFTIEWNFMRGKDMPHFPGRVFIESVGMPIIWHDYTRDVSSTMIRNEIIPLARSLVNFAREECLNESMLQLLEKAAMIDFSMVMKYVVHTLDNLGVPFSEEVRPGLTIVSPSSGDSAKHNLASVPVSPSSLSSSDGSSCSPAMSSAIPSPSLVSAITSEAKADSMVLNSSELALPAVHRFDLPPSPSVSLFSMRNEARIAPTAADMQARSAVPPCSSSDFSNGNGASSQPSTPRISRQERQKVFLAMIDGLFSLYRARSTELKSLTQGQTTTSTPVAATPASPPTKSPFIVINPCQ